MKKGESIAPLPAGSLQRQDGPGAGCVVQQIRIYDKSLLQVKGTEHLSCIIQPDGAAVIAKEIELHRAISPVNKQPRRKLRGITSVIGSLIEASFGEYGSE
jgi:hypothetical protein